MLTVVEKVLFLQDVDIFAHTSTEDLAYIGAITVEIFFKKNTDIYQEGQISDAMYLIIEGKVRLYKNKREVMTAGPKQVFGTWALFDDQPRIVTATTCEHTHLLLIDREEFYELLADHTKITQGVLKNLSRRLRSLIERVKIGTQEK